MVKDILGDLDGWEMTEPHVAVAGMDVPADAPIVQRLSRAIRPVAGEPVVEGAYYATDAGIYSGGGIPTVVFGPGDIADAHTAREHISIDQLQKAVLIIQNLLTAA
jgi:acetylornithine deacetylase